jgi:hypothetical protein
MTGILVEVYYFSRDTYVLLTEELLGQHGDARMKRGNIPDKRLGVSWFVVPLIPSFYSQLRHPKTRIARSSFRNSFLSSAG